jgi:hypothetical protein
MQIQSGICTTGRYKSVIQQLIHCLHFAGIFTTPKRGDSVVTKMSRPSVYTNIKARAVPRRFFGEFPPNSEMYGPFGEDSPHSDSWHERTGCLS